MTEFKLLKESKIISKFGRGFETIKGLHPFATTTQEGIE
jgi:hypothetical protein